MDNLKKITVPRLRAGYPSHSRGAFCQPGEHQRRIQLFIEQFLNVSSPECDVTEHISSSKELSFASGHPLLLGGKV